ncbi:MAG TPA: GAF and ANTAR domain-containing protein [Pseudonocardiaceae bacterium]|jgi:GAF domain-containing protein|nr:GAF and ANTAR domain-containing protein [Pseudonocardiaceae bacterium]
MQDLDSTRKLDQARAAGELQQLLLDTEDITEFLNEVVRYTANTLAPGLSCGMTVDRDGTPLTVASSDALARALDEVQYGHDCGPCLTAMRSGTSVIITDLATDDRWGDYRLDALAHGMASALSLPLDAGPGVRGALNIYAKQPQVFGAERQHQAEALVAEASRALRLAVRLTDQVQLSRHLEAAMASRSVIDQAIGVIMGQNRCTAAAAFEILRRASSHRNIKLRDVANEIVTRISGTHQHD